MKNKIIKIIVIFLIFKSFAIVKGNSSEKFNFDITEIEISENGNKIKGLKRGKITTNDNLTIKANEFEYEKISNILILKGNVIIKDLEKIIQFLPKKLITTKTKK